MDHNNNNCLWPLQGTVSRPSGDKEVLSRERGLDKHPSFHVQAANVTQLHAMIGVPACQSAYLRAGVPACLSACRRACMSACLFAYLPAYMPFLCASVSAFLENNQTVIFISECSFE